MKKITSGIRKSTAKGFFALVGLLFFTINCGGNLHAQEKDFHFGIRGGVGMATLNGIENNGLKLGITGGLCTRYHFSEHHSVMADINYSVGGQQSGDWTETETEKVKLYRKYILHYINLPVLYQYNFTDILSLEIGPNFRYCLVGKEKTKVGNESWSSKSLEYNSFDFGLLFGILTNDLFPFDDLFVSFRAYFGFLDVAKNLGSNKNVSIQVSIGYIFY